MTNFVNCRGCGHPIHETAPTCPKCGAPQQAAPSVSQTAMAPLGSPAPSAYAQIPWFRRRWVFLLIMLACSPIAAVIAWSGEIHYRSGDAIGRFPSGTKIAITCVAVAFAVALFFDEDTVGGLALLGLICVASAMALRK